MVAKSKLEELDANLEAIRLEHSKCNESTRAAGQTLQERNDKIDRHLERLEAGEPELTPPPFDLEVIRKNIR
jgi:predicted nuclease with TOPRIM domain